MTKRSGVDQTIHEIKKELKPFVDLHKEFKKLEKYAKKIQREKQIKKANEIKNFEKEIKPNIEKAYYCDQCGYKVLKDDKTCPNCEAQFIEETLETTYMCSNCHKLFKDNNKTKCPNCGAWFKEENPISNQKKELINKLNKHIMKENFNHMTKEELIDEINKVIKTIEGNINIVKNYISNTEELDNKKINSYENKINKSLEKVNKIEIKINKEINKQETLLEYNKIIILYNEINRLHKNIIGGVIAKLTPVGRVYKSKNADIISNSINKDYDNYIDIEEHNEIQNEYKEEQSNNTYNNDIVYNNLEDWQQKEVDEDNYDPYNFEEEELEEDDYYSEDED